MRLVADRKLTRIQRKKYRELQAKLHKQSGAFVIEHQKVKSAILRQKIVVPYKNVLGFQIYERKIILDSSLMPLSFYKKKDASALQFSATWTGQNATKRPVPPPGQKRKFVKKFNFTNQTKSSMV